MAKPLRLKAIQIVRLDTKTFPQKFRNRGAGTYLVDTSRGTPNSYAIATTACRDRERKPQDAFHIQRVVHFPQAGFPVHR